jgi:hypothetical protein
MGNTSIEREIAGFIAKYTPAIARDFKACRTRLRRLFPRGFELVYDNYNALAIGYATTLRASDVLVSIAAYPRWLTLFFMKGAALEDPGSLLQGSGNKVRSVRLETPAHLDRPAMRALIARALEPARDALDQAGALVTVVKSVSAKQRPRRPSDA